MALQLKFRVDDKATPEIKKLQGQLNKLKVSTNVASVGMRNMSKELAYAAAGFVTLSTAYDLVAKRGFAYNKLIEEQVAGLTALTVATSTNVDSMGKHLTLQEKYNLAGKESLKTFSALEAINAQTPHTLGQTSKIYKSMYPSMKAVGATTKEMVELTRSLSIASGAAGIEFNSLLAGVDGLATGTVLANSDLGRFLSSMGITNKVLKESSNVTALLTKRFGEFQAVDTMAVSVSNLTNQWDKLAGALTEDIFGASKGFIKDFTDEVEYLGGQWKALLLQFRDTKDITKIGDINIRLATLSRELSEAYESEGASWTSLGKKFWTNEDKKKHEENIASIKAEIKLMEEKKKALADTSGGGLVGKKDKDKPVSIPDYTNYDSHVVAHNAYLLEEANKLEEQKKALQQEATDSMKSNQDLAIENFMRLKEAIDDTWSTDKIEKFYKVQGDLINDAGKDNKKVAKDNYTGIQTGMSAAADLTQSLVGAYEAGSSGAKQMQDVTTAIRVADQVARVADLMMVATSETTKQGIYGQTALAAALTLPPPSNIPAFLTVGAMLASIGVSVAGFGGGGGGSSSKSAPDYSSQIDSADFQSGTNLEMANYGGNFDAFIEGLDSAAEKLEAFGNVGSSISETLEAYTESITAINDEQARLYANVAKSKEEGTYRWEAGVEAWFNEVNNRGILADLQSNRTDLLLETLADSLDFELMTLEGLKNINTSVGDLGSFDTEAYTDVLNEINELALLKKQGNLDTAGIERLASLMEVGGIWQVGQDYADALELINDALETSTDNIKTWTDSFKTDDELANDLASEAGFTLATTLDELSSIFNMLSTDAEGLSDIELDALMANKEMLTSTIDSFSDNMQSMAESIDSTIRSIKNSTMTTDELTNDEIKRINLTQSAFESSLASGDSDKARELLGEITSLSASVSNASFGDTSSINKNLISNLEANKAMIDFKDEVLMVRIVASDLDHATTTSTLTPTVTVANPTSNDDRLATLEAIMIEVLKTNNNVYDTLLRIQNDGLKAL
jgi:hypothetical protein